MKKKTNKKAFTLAEVLITLAIIGVIAAISVPSLIQKTNSAELKTAYKQAYAVALQALAKADYDGVLPTSRTSPYDPTNDRLAFNAFKNYLKVIKDCSGQVGNCFTKTDLDTSNNTHWGAPWGGDLAFIDSSGRVWTLWQETSTHTYDHIFVDTNGLKGPNKWGKDRFVIIDILDTRLPSDDITSTSQAFWSNSCPELPCYYTSWLAGKDN